MHCPKKNYKVEIHPNDWYWFSDVVLGIIFFIFKGTPSWFLLKTFCLPAEPEIFIFCKYIEGAFKKHVAPFNLFFSCNSTYQNDAKESLALY
jgi:hypothetical protein